MAAHPATQLPGVFPDRQFADVGCLLFYGPDVVLDVFNRVAVYVDRILKGAQASDLPIKQPTQFELVINLKAALGIPVPPTAFTHADKSIE
jgi:putative tryptophan/tyrosine transport system substrate-binding protein